MPGNWTGSPGSSGSNRICGRRWSSASTDNPDTGLRIAAALFPFWRSQGLLGEGRRWLDRLLAHHTGRPTVERVKALYCDSVLAELQGDLQRGPHWWRRGARSPNSRATR